MKFVSMIRDRWDNSRWPEPPLKVTILVREGNTQAAVHYFPIPIFTTVLELRLVLSLYFFRSVAVHVFYGDGAGRINLAFQKEDLLVSRLVGKDETPFFIVQPFKQGNAVFNKIRPENVDIMRHISSLSFREQMEFILKAIPPNGFRAQGIKQYVIALHEGYFSHVEENGFVLM